MHFLSLGGLLARLELEEELWAVPKLFYLVMLQFIPAAAYFELPFLFPFWCRHFPPPTETGNAVSKIQADPSPASSFGYVTDQLNNANQYLAKGDKIHLETALSHHGKERGRLCKGI